LETVSTRTGRLRIVELDADYLVSDQHPSPARLGKRLDEVVRKDLPAALGAVLKPALGASDESLWFIRRLDVPVDVNVAWEPETIAHRWAAQISRVLATDLCGAGDGTNVIQFPDRAAYLARFILDAASGDAWGRWIYRSFQGLRALPVSAALRTVLLDDAAIGLIALQQLALPDLATVIGALTEADAKRILNALAGDHETASFGQALAAAVAEWPSVTAACDVLSAPRTALALFVRVAGSGIVGRNTRAAAEMVAEIAAIVRTHPASSQLRHAITAGDWMLVRRVAGAAAPRLAVLEQCSTEQLDRVLGAVTPATADEHPAADIRSTRFGGALLLLPQLNAVGLDAVAGDWPALGGTGAAQMLRWLVLVKCLGRPRIDAAFRDPALRDLFRIAPDIGWPETAAWLAALSDARRRALARAFKSEAVAGAAAAADLDYLALPRLTGIDPTWKRVLTFGARRVMHGFVQRLPGFAQSRCAYLHRNLLDFAATLEFEPARIVVKLGRPPLHLMLSLIGASRGTLHLAWLDPRPLALFSED
jgi:hypothetical protein